MVTTLQQLCENANYLYGMRVLAGERAMSNIVQWVHTLEDVDASEFLHGNELVFTTGIAQKGTQWLIPYINKLMEHEASGLVVNYGPYIAGVPKDVIDYCSQQNFPLLEVPWKTRLVDITRDFCNQIIHNEKEGDDIGETFKNIIFYPGDLEKYMPVLARHDFDLKVNYCILGVKIQGEREGDQSYMVTVRMHLMKIINRYRGQAGYFSTGRDIFFILCGCLDETLHQIVDELQKLSGREASGYTLYIGVSSNRLSLDMLSKNYHKICSILHIAEKNNQTPLYYDQFGMKKILLSVDNPDILEEYYKDMLERLEVYDIENGTEYMEVLRMYLIYDGSIQRVAQETFVHRNTVNYQINKIKKILDMDLNRLEERFKLMLAYQISDII